MTTRLLSSVLRRIRLTLHDAGALLPAALLLSAALTVASCQDGPQQAARAPVSGSVPMSTPATEPPPPPPEIIAPLDPPKPQAAPQAGTQPAPAAGGNIAGGSAAGGSPALIATQDFAPASADDPATPARTSATPPSGGRAAVEARIKPNAAPAGSRSGDGTFTPTAATDAPASRASAFWGRSGKAAGGENPWARVGRDGIHDRGSEAIGVLQEPRQALKNLPRRINGNYVDWVQSLRSGAIRPRANRSSQGAMDVLDLDVVLTDTKTMPTVTFPHRAHTEWLACKNCHEWLFKAKAGANDIRMRDIFKGKQCGMCHGRVAFPPSQCFECHNGPRKTADAEDTATVGDEPAPVVQ